MSCMNRIKVFEGVGRGHPDRIADTIAERIAQLLIKEGHTAAIEVLCGFSDVHVLGESSFPNIPEDTILFHVRDVLEKCGYDPNRFNITHKINEQSIELQKNRTEKSRDQSVVIGYASKESQSYYDLGQALLEDVLIYMDALICENTDHLGHDYKVMVTQKGKQIMFVNISIHHKEPELSQYLREKIKLIVLQCANRLGYTNTIQIIINKGGSFTIGGLQSDTGLTGRKLCCNFYGTSTRIGGGAIFGKDYTKVDRLGAIYARNIALMVVKNTDCESVEVQLIYLPGDVVPIINITEINSEQHTSENIEKALKKVLKTLTFNNVHKLAVCGDDYFMGDYEQKFKRLLNKNVYKMSKNML